MALKYIFSNFGFEYFKDYFSILFLKDNYFFFNLNPTKVLASSLVFYRYQIWKGERKMSYEKVYNISLENHYRKLVLIPQIYYHKDSIYKYNSPFQMWVPLNYSRNK